MNELKGTLLKTATEEAIFNIYLYLAHRTEPSVGDTLSAITDRLVTEKQRHPKLWDARAKRQLLILTNATSKNRTLSKARLVALSRSKSGMNACVFEKPNGSISVVFRGTGDGEWIDNGEGLSGISEENTYHHYPDGETKTFDLRPTDFATDQQVEALNWFLETASQNQWNQTTDITVSGHSKGGNKAQFVGIHSALVDRVISFDGQGFSPEALAAMQAQFNEDFGERKQKLFSISAENDYVNVLGHRLIPKKHIYFLKSRFGIHHMDALLDEEGNLNPQTAQGSFSEYIEDVANEIMRMKPEKRQLATLGMMNLFQRYLGKGEPVNNDFVSLEKTVLGVAIAVREFLRKLK
ncbi:MAG: DUF2974 domain-containing protein [Clostridia bacterium]|nr:DUF2974 domain-containing protein [Clostridia bacterium]